MSYIWSLLGDSWYVVAALLMLLVLAVFPDILLGRQTSNPVVADDETQSQRDAKLFIQVEEYRRDFS